MRYTICTSVIISSLLAGCANWNVIEKQIKPPVVDPPGAGAGWAAGVYGTPAI